MEPTEMQEFTKQLHEANEGGGESLTHISLAISILAVLVAMVTVLGHRAHTKAILMQSLAGDQWSLYQAKKIRMDNLSVLIDLIPLQNSSDTAEAATRLGEYKAHIQKWKTDLAEEQQEAGEDEHEVHLAERRAGHYDLGEALLQTSVVLCSVTLFTRRRSYFFFGLAFGAVGLVIASIGLFIH